MLIYLKYNNLKIVKYGLYVKCNAMSIYFAHQRKKNGLGSKWWLVEKGTRKKIL